MILPCFMGDPPISNSKKLQNHPTTSSEVQLTKMEVYNPEGQGEKKTTKAGGVKSVSPTKLGQVFGWS